MSLKPHQHASTTITVTIVTLLMPFSVNVHGTKCILTQFLLWQRGHSAFTHAGKGEVSNHPLCMCSFGCIILV